jgi:hypothetical protein
MACRVQRVRDKQGRLLEATREADGKLCAIAIPQLAAKGELGCLSIDLTQAVDLASVPAAPLQTTIQGVPCLVPVQVPLRAACNHGGVCRGSPTECSMGHPRYYAVAMPYLGAHLTRAAQACQRVAQPSFQEATHGLKQVSSQELMPRMLRPAGVSSFLLLQV